ncbi:YD repeat-containing protein, partial [Inhella inkyongensis]
MADRTHRWGGGYGRALPWFVLALALGCAWTGAWAQKDPKVRNRNESNTGDAAAGGQSLERVIVTGKTAAWWGWKTPITSLDAVLPAAGFQAPSDAGLDGPGAATQPPSKGNAPADDCESSPKSGKPVILATGEKVLEETDFVDASLAGLSLTRIYRSATPSTQALFGAHWRMASHYPKLLPSTQAICDGGSLLSALTVDPRKAARLAMVNRFVRPTAALARINPSLAAQGANTGPKTGTAAAPNTGLCYPVDITLTLPDGAQYTFVNDFGPHYLPTGLGPDSKVGALVIQGFSQYDEWIVNIGPKIYAYKADTKQLKYIASAYGFELLQAFEYDSAGRLVKISSAGGSSLQFGYTGGRVTSVTDSALRVWNYGYDANGNLSSVLPPSGTAGARTYHYESPQGVNLLTGISLDGLRTTRYAYDASKRVVRSGDELGENVDTFSYGPSTTTLTDQRGQSTTYTFETVGAGFKRLVATSRAATSTCGSAARSQSFDARGFLTNSTDWRGTQTKYSHDFSGRLLEQIDGFGSPEALRTVYTWAGADLSTVKEYGSNGALLRTTSYSYHSSGLASGKVATETLSNASGSVQRVRSFAYGFHPNTLLASVTETLNLPGGSASRSSSYDSSGRLIASSNLAGHASTFSGHNAMGYPSVATDSNGVSSQLVWDAAGRLIGRTQVLAGGNRSTTWTFNAGGQLLSQTESGVSVHYARNSAGRVTGVSFVGASSTEVLDVANRTHSTSAPRLLPSGGATGAPGSVAAGSFSAALQYDSLGRPYLFTAANGQRTRFGHDNEGNLLWQDDINGRRTSYSYDALGRLRTHTEPGWGSIEYGYDSSGQLDTIKDGRGLITDHDFDVFGNLVRLTSPDTGVRSTTPDNWGRPLSVTRNDGSQISYGWDALSRLRSRSSGAQSESYGYDAGPHGKGRLTSLSDASGSSSYAYDGAGALTQQVNVIQGQSLSTGWGYNAAGRLAWMSYPVAGLVLQYGYDAHGRLSSLSATLNGSTITLADSFVYHPGSTQPLAWRLGNNLQRRLVQDASGRLVQVASPGVQDLSLNWNTNDTVASLNNGAYPAQSASLGYDSGLRLSSYNGGGNSLSHGYDAVGNRISSSENGSNLAPSVAAGSNRVTAVGGPQWRNLAYN